MSKFEQKQDVTLVGENFLLLSGTSLSGSTKYCQTHPKLKPRWAELAK